MKTLYVSDLDGTLLRSNETTSDFTNKTINELVDRGMLFSYATARSYVTSKKVTKGLDAKIPLIVYNGAFVIDNITEDILLSNFFGKDVHDLLNDLIESNVYPIVYSFLDGVEHFSYIYDKSSKGVMDFVRTRTGDHRDNPVQNEQQLHCGDIFYISCIDDESKLIPFYEKYKNQYHCIFQRDIYSKEQWLEVMPLTASKANAIKQLKKHLCCDKVVVFGDGKNDIDMFILADECYAVANAVEDLKEIATEVIPENNNDGVAQWLLQNFASDSN